MVRVLYLLFEIMFIVYITYEYHSWVVKRALCLRAYGNCCSKLLESHAQH